MRAEQSWGAVERSWKFWTISNPAQPAVSSRFAGVVVLLKEVRESWYERGVVFLAGERVMKTSFLCFSSVSKCIYVY